MPVQAIILYAALAGCALVTAQAVRRYDLHAREPVWALFAALVLGMAGMYLAGRVQSLALVAINSAGELSGYSGIALRAGISEELAKFLVAGAMIIIARKSFDENVDGLIYGAFAGLGAAVEESAAILRAVAAVSPNSISPFPAAEVVRLTGHLVMGGIGGFGWGALISRWPRWPLWMFLCLLGAIALHTLWDLVAFDAMNRARVSAHNTWIDAALSVSLMLLGLLAFRVLVWYADKHDDADDAGSDAAPGNQTARQVSV